MVLTLDGIFALEDATTLTIDVDGVVVANKAIHIIAALTGTEDDLETITRGTVESGYSPFTLITADAGDTINIIHQADNIYIPGGGDVVLTENNRALFYDDGTNQHLLNAVGQADAFTITNWTENLSLDCDAASNDQLADMVGTFAKILIAAGLYGGTVSA